MGQGLNSGGYGSQIGGLLNSLQGGQSNSGGNANMTGSAGSNAPNSYGRTSNVRSAGYGQSVGGGGGGGYSNSGGSPYTDTTGSKDAGGWASNGQLTAPVGPVSGVYRESGTGGGGYSNSGGSALYSTSPAIAAQGGTTAGNPYKAPTSNPSGSTPYSDGPAQWGTQGSDPWGGTSNTSQNGPGLGIGTPATGTQTDTQNTPSISQATATPNGTPGGTPSDTSNTTPSSASGGGYSSLYGGNTYGQGAGPKTKYSTTGKGRYNQVPGKDQYS